MPGEFDPLAEYADDAALRKQTDFILSLFDEIEKKGLGTADTIKAAFHLFDNKGSGTKELIDDIKQLQLTSSNYQKILSAVAAEVENLTDAQKAQLKLINEQFKSEETLRAGAKETVNLIKTEIGLNEKLSAGRSALAQTISNNREQIRQENLERTRLARVLNSENNSKQKAQAIIDLLINKGKKLNLETEQGRRVNEAYNKTIEKQNAFILANADVETKRIKNIGNYQGSAKIIVDALEKARTKVVQLTKEFGQLSPEAAAANQEFEGLQRITENPKFLNISAKIGDVRGEMTHFINTLADLRNENLQDTQVYKDTEERIVELTKSLKETRESVKALASDHRAFDLFASSVETVASSFELASGAAALFGVDTEHIEKVTQRLVAIQNVANGAREIAKQITEKGTAANKVYAFVQSNVTKAMDGTAKASVRLRAALAATGVLALVAAIGFLISKLNIFGDDTEKAKEETERLNKALEAQKKAIDDINESLDFQSKIRAEQLKQRDATEEQLFNNELNTKKEQLKNLRQLEKDNFNQLLGQVREFQKEAAKAYDKFGDKFSLSEEMKKGLFDRYNIFNNALKESTENRVKKEQEIQLFGEEYKTKVHVDAVKKQKEIDDKAAAEAKKRAEKALELAVELEKRKAAAILGITKANINEQIRVQESISQSDESTLQEKLDAEARIAAAKRALLSIEYTEAIAAETRVEDGKKVIYEKTAEEKLLAETNYNNAVNALLADSLQKAAALRKADNEKRIQELEDLKKNIYEANNQGGINAANINAIKRNQALLKLDEDYQAGRIKNAEEYEKKKQKIIDRYSKMEIEAALETAEEKLMIAIFYGDSTLEIEKEITELKLQLLDKEVADTRAAADKKLAIENELKNKKIELAQAGKDLFLSIVEGQFTRQKNQIAELIQLNEDQKNAEIQRINESQLAESDKVAKIALINAEAQQKKEGLEKRQRQLDLQKAEFDRMIAIAEVVANTAKAVSKDLIANKLAIPLDIAIGAAQIAAILAKPLPKFKDGLFTDYEGYAIVGDGGRSEAHIKADGSVDITPSTDTVTWINKGDRIHPDADQMMRDVQSAALRDTARAANKKIDQHSYGELMTASLEKQLQENAEVIVKAIKEKKELHLSARRDSLAAMWKYGANQISYLDENTNWNN